MKIDSIESLFIGNGYVVRIHTDNGLSGIGQTACWGYPEAVDQIVQTFKKYLIGQNPLRIETSLAISLSHGAFSRFGTFWSYQCCGHRAVGHQREALRCPSLGIVRWELSG